MRARHSQLTLLPDLGADILQPARARLRRRDATRCMCFRIYLYNAGAAPGQGRAATRPGTSGRGCTQLTDLEGMVT